jgi:hypothetical protein
MHIEAGDFRVREGHKVDLKASAARRRELKLLRRKLAR